MNSERDATKAARAHPANPAWLDVVVEAVQSIRFGVVEIIVHEGRVTQVEKTERVRFANGSKGEM